MKFNAVPIFVLTLLFSLGACEKKQQPGQKTGAPEKKGSAGYVINFKPNDSPDLVPAKTLMLVQAPAEGTNNFCLDVNARVFDSMTAVSFTLNFDPAMVEYQSFKPGGLFEPKGTVAYGVAPLPDQKGKLQVKVSFESGNTATGGTGNAVTLCFKAKAHGRSDVSLELGQVLDAKKTQSGQSQLGGWSPLGADRLN